MNSNSKVSRTRLSFRFKELYLGEEKTGFSVIKDTEARLYRVRWPDGVLSKDIYNLTRAKENSVVAWRKSNPDVAEIDTEAPLVRLNRYPARGT